MKKVRLFSNYSTDQELLGYYGINKKDSYEDTFELTLNDDYDVAVIFNSAGYSTVSSSAYRIVIAQEPSWSPVWRNNPWVKDNDIFIVHDASLFGFARNVFESPTIMHYSDALPIDFILEQSLIKTKKLSFIVSNLNFCPGHDRRLRFLRRLINSKLEFDLFGRGHSVNDRRCRGELRYKYSGLADYEYSICIENSCENNYITEKFTDALMYLTVPIYVGAPNISNIYSSSGFEILDIDDQHCLDHLEFLVSQNYQSRIDALLRNRQIYLEEYSVQGILRRFI